MNTAALSRIIAGAWLGASALGLAADPGPSAALPPLLPPAQLLQPLKDAWPTYSGDYTGQRYSALRQVDKSNVSHLSLAWTTRMNGEVRDGRARNPFAPPSALITSIGGEGKGDYAIPPPAVKERGIAGEWRVLYVTAPGQRAWALDARSGAGCGIALPENPAAAPTSPIAGRRCRNSSLFSRPRTIT